MPASCRTDPDWYKRAVFYEVLVRAFHDSDGNGTGDLRGLTEKLDYIAVARRRLHLAAAVLRLAAARRRLRHQRLPRGAAGVRHHRGLRDVPRRGAQARDPRHHRPRHEPHLGPAQLVPGVPATTREGPYGDFYVWSDDDSRYADARIIFIDTETSNWTYDPVRGQFYWHRFFSHQPDLNYENPAVQEAMIDVLRFWLDLGIDGFRLDAVPYLFEEEGTNCENLPRTHAFLQALPQGHRRRVPGPRAARRGQPVARRRGRVLRRPGRRATSATWRSTSR